MKYKVLIPSAGLGSRLGDLCKNINKALVPIENKPSICYIIEKFPENIEIIVAIGHKGEILKQFLSIAYPDRKITFVNIDPYQGQGSGLGYTILQCKKYLQCPFIFCSNDTILIENIPAPTTNWMGYAEVKNNEKYRSVILRPELGLQYVEKICEKGEKCDSYAYIGLAGIRDYDDFWRYMTSGVNNGAITIGECYALSNMKNIHAKKFNWFDTGDLIDLHKASDFFKKSDSPNILQKQDEFIWFVENKVIKYSIDKEFIKNRLKRVSGIKEYIPKILGYKDNMYSYKFINGKTISKMLSAKIFKRFLLWSKDFWKKANLNIEETEQFEKCCMSFYKDKTFKRVEKYFNRFSYIDSEEIINDIPVPKLLDLLNKVDWENLSQGIPSRYHGDFHFENILVAEGGDFVLLDWRQDFAGLEEYGDLYYDLAKLLHGSIVQHDMIDKNLFIIDKDADIITFDILRKHKLIECDKIFEDFALEEGYDFEKVKLLTALIFLNIAPLHHYPYSEFLFYLGKYQLHNVLISGGI